MSKTRPEPVRDPKNDHQLTPQNCAIVLIDFQPGQYATVGSAPAEEIDLGAVTLAELAHAYAIPTVWNTPSPRTPPTADGPEKLSDTTQLPPASKRF
ncbi:hypothetical protein [Nocardia nepalensis]|uniref:hypothetical protein n=1 Tax=Nocardia nepalensis TaxID=3375448 RepID=UPI003B6709E1